jgi:hypothetical protein
VKKGEAVKIDIWKRFRGGVVKSVAKYADTYLKDSRNTNQYGTNAWKTDNS